ncbi:hypothetical protein DRE_03867 [Drechslerella stenobrocha 248]|uniref:Uncharacterized protein n=1 Tax=Drechslerella stenobrocha 248 TaxID=1043628 RepID=W7ICK6_9PEZI|nr:hypothetical protein DRE_03867 [Drechslerella stenobrocha 248]
MGKLTYVNRRITGIKLAQSIQRDIQKRIPKPGEEKKLAAVQRDPVIELDISGRQLGPEGIVLVCDSLWALGCTKLSRVEELNLSGNDLTAACLRPLRRALSVCPDLRDFDLSNNVIKVTTLDDMKEWGHFLEGFADLKCLRRLDVSHNPLGDIAVEILFRTYALECEIFLPYNLSGTKKIDSFDEPTDVDYSIEGFDIRSSGGHLYLSSHPAQAIDGEGGVVDGIRESKVSVNTISTQSVGILSSSPESSTDSSHDLVELHGLRGIPYIVLSDIKATDLSAMWLSYIITEHPLPADLHPHLPPLKEGPLAATLRKYDAMPNCRGIILSDNPGITPVGQRVLKEAEERRDEDAARVEELFTNGQGRRRSSAVSDMSIEDLSWRNSIGRTGTKDGPANLESWSARSRKLLNDERYSLDRTRAKIQLSVLREKGVGASLLWSRVMRLVVVSRAILLDYSGPIRLDGAEPTLQIDMRDCSARSSLDSTFRMSPDTPPATNDALSKKVSDLDLSATGPTQGAPNGRNVPGNLPIDVWMKIILLAEDSDDLTTRSQRLNIFQWARSRASITSELKYLAESTETQTRRVIAKVKGLAYEL